MGYLGSNLDDYYSRELIEHVITQIKNNDTGDWELLKISVKKLLTAMEKSEKKYDIKKKENKNGIDNNTKKI